MRGELTDVFDLSRLGVVVTVTMVEGDFRIGDWLVVDERSWRIKSIAHLSYRGIPPEHARNQTSVQLESATKAELLDLVGRQCHTERREDVI